MPNLLVTLDYSDWLWADWMTPPYSEGALTASDVTDADTLAYITDEIPKLSIVYGGEKYDAEGTALYVMGTERTGTAYGDETFTNYPFYLVVPSSMGSNFTMYVPTENPGSLTVKLYDYYEEDPLACNWKEGIVLTPPTEEECIPCEEIADLDERVTALENSGSEIVTVIATGTGGNDMQTSMSFAEIEQAIASGKTVIMQYDPSGQGYADTTYYLNLHSDGSLLMFIATDPLWIQAIRVMPYTTAYAKYSVVNPTQEQTVIAVSDWSNNTATKNVTGVTTNNIVLVSPDPTSADDYASAGILCTAQAYNSLTFTCDTVPSSSVTVNVVII